MSKNRRRGKDLERFIARDAGGIRLGVMGKVDVLTDRFAIECKEREKFPAIIEHGFGQALRNSLQSKRIPILILHKLNQGHELDLVMMQYQDWKDLINGGKP